MTGLSFEPRRRISRVVIAGCGGTGAYVARAVARTAYDMARRGLQPPGEILLVDPDRVEEKNVGRQAFAPCDIGQPKSAVIARRLSYALGVAVSWADVPFEARLHADRNTLVVGCVDNHLARRSLAAGDYPWIDCGNHDWSGQVIVGTTGDRERATRAFENPRNGVIDALPYATLLYPELLDPPPDDDPEPGESCAERVEAGEQGLLVNDLVAVVAAGYVYKLLHRQPLTTFMTTLDAETMSVRGVGIDVDVLLIRME